MNKLYRNEEHLISRTFLEIFLIECNEDQNRYYQKHRWCFLDFDDYREAVHAVLQYFLIKFRETGEEKYTKRGYIYSAFVNKAKENARKIKNKPLLEYLDYIDLDKFQSDSVNVDPDSYVISGWIFKIFKVAGMTEQETAIFLEKKVNGKTNVQIAEMFSISEKTVQNRLKAVESKLKQVVKIVV